MNREQQERLRTILAATWEDARLSRGEARALEAVLEEVRGRSEALAFVRNAAFDLAQAHARERPAAAIAWLRGIVKAIDAAGREPAPVPRRDRVAFGPGEACRDLLLSHLRRARRLVDVCVFTITDDRITRALLAAHRRRVAVRVISDDEKATDEGSDVDRLEAAGIEVRRDRGPEHMHHKFALVDGRTLLNGSYNWTRGATRNHENLCATDFPEVVERFRERFEALWETLGRGR